MKPMKLSLLTCLLGAFALQGCHTTRVYAPVSENAPTHHDRQWFTLAGLVPLSNPAGAECKEGVVRVESEMGVVDGLIAIGLGIVGGAVGIAACDKIDEQEAYATCISGFTSLMPFLFSSRSVNYQCEKRTVLVPTVSTAPPPTPAPPAAAPTPTAAPAPTAALAPTAPTAE